MKCRLEVILVPLREEYLVLSISHLRPFLSHGDERELRIRMVMQGQIPNDNSRIKWLIDSLRVTV